LSLAAAAAALVFLALLLAVAVVLAGIDFLLLVKHLAEEHLLKVNNLFQLVLIPL